MVTEQEYMRHEGLEIAYYILAIVIMGILLPIIVGFSLRGFEESFVPGKPLAFNDILTNYLIYYILIIGAMTAVIFPIVKLLTINKGDHPATQPNPNLWRILSVSLIHDPEDGALYTLFRKGFGMGHKKNWARWTISIIRMYVIGTLLWAGVQILALLNIIKFNVLGLPGAILQQITPFISIVFSAEPPSTGETGTMLVILMLLMGLNAYLCAKYIKDRTTALIVYYSTGLTAISAIIGFIWMSWHNLVYHNSAIGLYASFVFGFLGAFLTILFYSWVIWYTLHFWQNTFNKIKELYPANADVVFYAILAWTGLLIIYVAIEILIYRYRKKHPKQTYEDYQEPTY